jgi:hypothetical protein
MLPVTQDYVTHGDMSNEERSFNPFPGKPETYNQSNKKKPFIKWRQYITNSFCQHVLILATPRSIW